MECHNCQSELEIHVQIYTRAMNLLIVLTPHLLHPRVWWLCCFSRGQNGPLSTQGVLSSLCGKSCRKKCRSDMAKEMLPIAQKPMKSCFPAHCCHHSICRLHYTDPLPYSDPCFVTDVEYTAF